MNVSLVSVFVNDTSLAVDFFKNKLGFDLISNFELKNGVKWVTFRPGEENVDLLIVEVSDESPRSTNIPILVFECENLINRSQELEENGVIFIKRPTKEFYGLEAVICDDFGNKYSLVEK